MSFLSSESGAVTVDWVVLASFGVGLALAVMAVVSTGAQTQTTALADTMDGIETDMAPWDRPE